MIVGASVATALFLGGWLRPFAGVGWLNFLDFVPTLLMAGVGAYCIVRAPKQPGRVQQLFMLAVAGALFFVGFGLGFPPLFSRLETVFYRSSHRLFFFFLIDLVHLLLFM